MRRYVLAALIALFSSWSLAADSNLISLNFRQARLVDFAEATYKAILGRNFILTPEAASSDRRITISVQAIPKDSLPGILKGVLAQAGLVVISRNGIDYIEPAALPSSAGIDGDSLLSRPLPGYSSSLSPAPTPSVPDKVEVYRPRYRSPDYLYAVLGVLGLSAPAKQDKVGSTDLVILSGSDEQLKKARSLLEQVDSRPASVAVRAAVIEYTDRSDNGFSIGAVASLLSGKLSIAFNPSATLSNFVRIKTGGIDAALSAINGDSRFHLVSEPNIRIVDGEKGRIVVGSDEPVRGAVSYDKNGNPIQSIEYRTSGVQLSVLPRIFRDRISASVFHQVSNFGETKTSGIDSPTLFKRELETQVDLDDGELLLLGGLDENKTTNSKTGLAFLPAFMQTKSDNSTKTQLIVMLEMRKI